MPSVSTGSYSDQVFPLGPSGPSRYRSGY